MAEKAIALATKEYVDKTKWNILWSNASPGSNFAAQTISINGLSEYNLFVIQALSESGYPVFSILCYVPTTGGTSFELMMPNAVSGKWGAWHRGVTINRSTETVKFNTAYWSVSGSTTTASKIVIPLYILGTTI